MVPTNLSQDKKTIIQKIFYKGHSFIKHTNQKSENKYRCANHAYSSDKITFKCLSYFSLDYGQELAELINPHHPNCELIVQEKVTDQFWRDMVEKNQRIEARLNSLEVKVGNMQEENETMKECLKSIFPYYPNTSFCITPNQHHSTKSIAFNWFKHSTSSSYANWTRRRRICQPQQQEVPMPSIVDHNYSLSFGQQQLGDDQNVSSATIPKKRRLVLPSIGDRYAEFQYEADEPAESSGIEGKEQSDENRKVIEQWHYCPKCKLFGEFGVPHKCHDDGGKVGGIGLILISFVGQFDYPSHNWGLEILPQNNIAVDSACYAAAALLYICADWMENGYGMVKEIGDQESDGLILRD